jgi:hypothetical protein
MWMAATRTLDSGNYYVSAIEVEGFTGSQLLDMWRNQISAGQVEFSPAKHRGRDYFITPGSYSLAALYAAGPTFYQLTGYCCVDPPPGPAEDRRIIELLLDQLPIS